MPIQVTKVALLGDVHANLPALQAVLSHARREGVEAIINIGDFVGYGPFPNQVVKRIRKLKMLSIIGNYDQKVLDFPNKNEKWLKKKHPLKWFAFKWAYEQLSKKSRRYLRSLPGERYVEIGGINLLLVHGSPESNEELLTADTSDQRLWELNQMVKGNYGDNVTGIICGHSHQAFTRQVENTWFVNTGSVGRPDDGDPRAAYAVLEIHTDTLRVAPYRLDYDVDKSVDAIRQKGLPEAFAQMLIQGRDLETVLQSEPLLSQYGDG
jgi:putative phosphoesterase